MFTFLIIAVTILLLLLLGSRHIVKWARFIILARKLPSPKSVPFIGHIEFIIKPHSDMDKITRQYFHECPRLYSIWLGPFPVVFLRDPRDIEVVLGRGMKSVKKSFIHYFLKKLIGDGLGNSEDKKWEQHRKLLNPAFHIKVLENFIQVLVRKSEILVQKLETKVGPKGFDVNTYFSRATVDVLYESVLEKESNCLEEEVDNKFIRGVQLGSKHIMRRAISPWLYPDIIYWNTSSGRECNKLIDDVLKEVQEIINCKRQNLEVSNNSDQHTEEDEMLGIKKKTTYLQLLLEASQYGVKLSEMDIIDEIRTFTFAGFDSLRITLCWAMQILGNHPEIQDKIYEELENIFQGSDRSHTMKDLAEMKYLERVIKEVLRLYPAVPFITRVAIRDLEIGGYTIPAGMMINIAICHLHQNAEIYSDPEKFDPERFLPELVHRHPYAYIPFGAGPRGCIAQKFAMMQMKMILSYIIRNYKIHSMREKLTPFVEVILTSYEGFYISITKRNPKLTT